MKSPAAVPGTRRRRPASPAGWRVTGMAASCHSGAGRGEDGDGSATVYFGPATPRGVKDGNWIQTVPAKGRSTLFRLCSPLGPFFGKTWHPSGTEPT